MQVFTGSGLGFHSSSLRLGSYGPKGTAAFGQGGNSVYVNAANGNLVLQQDDGFLANTGMGLRLLQTYNSKGEMGSSWRFNMHSSIKVQGTPNTAGSLLTRTAEDGHSCQFHYDENKKMYVSDDGGTERITYSQNQWIYQDGDHQSTSYYNQSGQLIRIADKDGHSFNFSYVNNELVSISDNTGKQQITWSFAQGLLTDVTVISDGALVHHLHYEYNEHQQLSKVSRDLGNGKVYWVTYDYVENTNLIRDIKQSDGTSLHIDYDSQGRVSRMVDGAGRTSVYAYDQGKTTITNGLGEAWTYYYDASNQLTGVDGPEQYRVRYYYEGGRLSSVVQGTQVWRFAYNDQGDCIRIEEPNGQITQRVYDSEHRLILESSYQNFDGTHHPIDKQSTRYVYDELGHLRFEIAVDGTVTEHRYDSEGRLTSSRTYLHSAYDLKGISTDTILTQNELLQWQAKQNQADISLVGYGYDWRGQLTEEMHYAKVDSQGCGISTGALSSHFRYDAAGRLVEKSVPTDKGWSITHYLYDDLGRLIQTIDNHNNIQKIEYDDLNHRIIQTDANGLQTIKLYDNSGLLLSIIRMDAHKQYGRTEYQYDAAGRLIAETGENGLTSYNFYNHLGQLEGRIDTAEHITEYRYNTDGLLIQTHQFQQNITTKGWNKSIPEWSAIKPTYNANDRIEQIIYNQYNQIAYKINAEGAVIGYEYNARGQVLTSTAYATRLKEYQPNQLLTLAQIKISTNAADRTIRYYYDSEERLQAKIDSEGYAIEYHYDRLGNVIETRKYAQAQTKALTGLWEQDKPEERIRDIHLYTFYDARGLKVGEIDGENYVTEYFYDDTGLVKETRSYANKTNATTIDRNQSLEQYSPTADQNDHHTYYTYNDLGQLIEERKQNGLITTYAYDVMGNTVSKTMTDLKTHKMRQQQHRYDAMGRLIQSLDEYGVALLYQNNLTEQDIEKIWQAHSQSYEYNAAGLLISTTNALQQKTSYFYDDYARLAYTVKADGAVEECHYTAFNQLESVRKYSQLLKQNVQTLSTSELQSQVAHLARPQEDELIRYEYNTLGQVIAKHTGSKGVINSSYSVFGDLERTVLRIDGQHSRITAYEYDRRGLLTRSIDDVDGIAQQKTMAYDAYGLLRFQIDGRGNKLNFKFNSRGEQIEIFKESSMESRKTKTLVYDAFGRMIAETGYNTMWLNKYTYDDVNGTLTLTHDDGSQVLTQFNAFGDKVCIKDGNGFETRFEFDEKGLLTRVDGSEQHTKKYSYNALGQLSFEVDASGHTTAYTYDANGRILTQVKDPNGVKSTTTYQYDGLGRTLSITDPNSMQKIFTYDDQGNLLSTCIDPNGLNVVTQFTYDERGQLLRQTELNPQGKNKVTAYEWDALGRRVAIIQDPDGLKLTTRYQYDQNDNVTCIIDANLHATYYVFDVDNQCRYQISPRGVVTEYVYDADGLTTQTITYANAIKSAAGYSTQQIKSLLVPDTKSDRYQFYKYDNYGHLLRSYDALGYCTAYTYDANGNVLSKTQYAVAVPLEELKKGQTPDLPIDGARTEFMLYDGANQLRFKWADNYVTETRYDNGGQVVSITRYANKIPEVKTQLTLEQMKQWIQPSIKDRTTYYAYNSTGLLVKELSPEGIAKSYTYDALGHIRTSTHYATRFNATSTDLNQLNFTVDINDRSTRYVYDAAGREIYRISGEGRVIERRYDAVGNVIQEVHHAALLNPAIDTADAIKNALEAKATTASITQYEYDAVGRLKTQKNNQHLTQQYTYDAQGNVLSKTEANGVVWTYTYNESNQLIKTTSPEVMIGQTKRGIVTLNTYDSFGNLTSTVKDAEGIKQTIQYEYDLKNQKIKTIYPDVLVNNAQATSSAQRQEATKTLYEEVRYNPFGQAIAVSDKANHWTQSIYDARGLLTYSINSQCAVTRYEYNAFAEVSSKTRYATTVSVDSLSELAKRIQPSNADRVEHYEYDREGKVIETYQKATRTYNPQTKQYSLVLNPTTQTTYNTFGEPIKVATKINETDWANTFYYYDRDGKNTAQINAEHYLTTYSYDALGHLTETTERAAAVTQYDVASYSTPLMDAKDRTVQYTYDDFGQLRTKTLKNVAVNSKDKNGTYTTVLKDLTTTYSYDALGHLTSTTDPQGNTAYCYYDNLGQLIAKVAPKTQDGRAATTYSYDALGNLVETIKWAAGASEADESHFSLNGASALDQKTKQHYDAQGRLIEQTDSLNHIIYYSYDENGDLARSWQTLTQIDKSTKIEDKRYSYDSEHHLLQTKTFKTANTAKTEDAQYNSFGELTAKGINGVYNTYVEYDTQGRVWRSNTQGHYEIYVYDLLGRVTQVVSASNGGFQNSYFDGDLSKSGFEDDLIFDHDTWAFDLQRQNNTYDALGNLLIQTKEFSQFQEGVVSLQTRTLKQRFDRWGNMLSSTNAKGMSTEYEYNSCNQLIKQELPQVTVMDEHGAKHSIKPTNFYYYDDLGRAIGMMDANGHTVSKEYDAAGHLIKETDAKGATRQKHYNLLDQLTETTNELGGLTTYTYDTENRLTDVRTAKSQQHYEYDEAGKLIKQTNGLHEESLFWYDTQGNQIKQQNARGKTTSYEYDDAGHKIKEVDALGHNQTWVYNQQGLVQEHTDLGGHKTSYQYNVNGLLETEQSTAEKNIKYVYQGNGELLEYNDYTHKEFVNFQYDEEGQLIRRESGRGENSDGWLREIDYYSYDELGRLSQLSRKNPDEHDKSLPTPDTTLLSVQYDYDAVGNIRHTSVRANYTGYHALQTDDYFLYDENNRMTLNKGQLVNNQMVITTTKGTSLAYDAAGNIKQALNYENGTLQQYDYQYNNENQLELTKKDGMSQQAKIYDAAGHVVQENLFNNKGVLTQKNIMTYEKGTLVTQSVRDQFDKETSLTVSTYDDVGNVTNSNLRVFAQGSQSEYSLNHHYTYALWDNYLQEEDEATRIMYGATYHGRSTRSYDANGLLKASVDQQADANGKTNSTQYWNSGIDGIKARSDSSGKTHYLTFNHKTLGDLRLDDLKNQHLNVFGGFTPQGSQNGAAQSTGQFLERSAAENEGIPPESTQDNLGAYTLQQGDSLESIAFQVYGDGSLWYLIADANGLSCGKNETAQSEGSLHTGQRLNLPPVATGQHHTSKTRRVFSSDYMIGMTAATTKIPLPPPPPPTPARHHGLLSKIVVGIVATIATVLTAGVIGALAGVVAASGTSIFAIGTTVLGGGMASLAGNLAAGFAAGFMGSIASQGMARSFHMQEGISLKGALVNGLISAASTGTLSQLKEWGPQKNLMTKLAEKTPSEFNLVSATQTMENNVTSQSLGLLTRQQHNFEWDQLGTSAITAGILGGKTGQRLQDALKKLDFKTGMLASELNTATHALVGASVTGTAQNMGDALKNNLGHAIGNGIVNADSSNGEDESKLKLDELLYTDTVLDVMHPERMDGEIENRFAGAKGTGVIVNKPKTEAVEYTASKKTKPISKQTKIFKSFPKATGRYNKFTLPESNWQSKAHYAYEFVKDNLNIIKSLEFDLESHFPKADYKGKYDINYQQLFGKKGWPYKKVASHSLYYKSPGSPIVGDASNELQMESIDTIITVAKEHKLSLRDTAHVLAIARHESGFNPYAAAGSTSAAGLGQYVNGAWKDAHFGAAERWDIKSQAEALVNSFQKHKIKTIERHLPETYIYKFHHDGPDGEHGGLDISEKSIYPKIKQISVFLKKIF